LCDGDWHLVHALYWDAGVHPAIPVAYHWPTVLLSLFAAILASVVALGVVSRQKMGWFRALAGSVLMGAGIASMHYIGMAAMRYLPCAGLIPFSSSCPSCSRF